eukprot:GEMP01085668.1.p4 GENE.GEMP01085668.1~~GEMP01085668.1.p4  ORF type:complete len:105 (+),score=10.60 GEMP01085668.1:283-597(+)
MTLEPVCTREIIALLDQDSLLNLALTCKPVAVEVVTGVCFRARCAKRDPISRRAWRASHLMHVGSFADTLVNRFTRVLEHDDILWPDAAFDALLAHEYVNMTLC